MAKNHGARQQKKLAKQKARRSEKSSQLLRHNSDDPAIRLQGAEKWPIVQTLVGADLWDDGIGYLVIARQESAGRLIYANYLVDVFCLGVKDAFWQAGTAGEFADLVQKLGTTQTMSPIAPACLVKIVRGAVEFALSFGFRPHPDFRHAAMLLQGIDPATCPHEFTFGREGKPLYIQGPHESTARAAAISRRIHEAGGDFLAVVPDPGSERVLDVEDAYDPLA